jgi:hypothetical protein
MLYMLCCRSHALGYLSCGVRCLECGGVDDVGYIGLQIWVKQAPNGRLRRGCWVKLIEICKFPCMLVTFAGLVPV